MVLHVALVAEPLGADVALYDECCLASPVPRLVLDNVRGLHEQIANFFNRNVLNNSSVVDPDIQVPGSGFAIRIE